jgi:hypothetical protein
LPDHVNIEKKLPYIALFSMDTPTFAIPKSSLQLRMIESHLEKDATWESWNLEFPIRNFFF